MSQITKMFIFIVFFPFTLCSFSCIEAADLIAVIVCDSDAKNLEVVFENELACVREEMRRIAKYNSLNLREEIFEGADLYPEHVLQEMEKISCHPDDVLIFYACAHGYRTIGKIKSPWPNLYFTTSAQGVPLEEFFDACMKKEPRLLLAIGMACNSYLPFEYAPPVYTPKNFEITPVDMVQWNYRDLFTRVRGVIFITSSTVGEYSYALKGKTSLFLAGLMEALRYETCYANGTTWDRVMDRLSDSIWEFQTPYFELYIHYE